ncbi:MAG: hypothetical protein ABJA83_05780 [Burkholderiaceae bacterium]
MGAWRAFILGALILSAAASSAADLRGFVSEGGAGVLQYQPCNGVTMSQQLFPINDRTPNGSLRDGIGAVRQIMLHRYRPLYVEMRGERAKTDTTVYQFQRVLGTVESCKTLPRDIASNVRVLAFGEGPTWRLLVSDSAAVLELPDKVSVKLPVAAFKSSSKAQPGKETLLRTYEVRSTDGIPIRIEINPLMCTDGKSETAYGARVGVRFEKRVLQGCAARF